MLNDAFSSQTDSPASPARRAVAVTAHDTNELPSLPKALYVGTGGTLVLRTVDATADVTFKNVASGQVLDLRVQYVRATGTTAADIVALA